MLRLTLSKEATPEQVKYLKNNLDKIKQQTTAEKLNRDRKARKYILNQVKNKTTVPEFKLNTEVPDARPSTPVDKNPEPVKPVTREDTIKAIEEWSKSQPKRDEDMTGIFATNQYFFKETWSVMNKYEIKYFLEQQTSAVDRLTDTNGKLTTHIEELWDRNKSLQETSKISILLHSKT